MRSVPSSRAVVEGGERLAVEVDHPPRIGKQPLAFLGEPVGAAVLLEQRLADALLQPPHLHGHRGLGAVHLLGGAVKLPVSAIVMKVCSWSRSSGAAIGSSIIIVDAKD